MIILQAIATILGSALVCYLFGKFCVYIFYACKYYNGPKLKCKFKTIDSGETLMHIHGDAIIPAQILPNGQRINLGSPWNIWSITQQELKFIHQFLIKKNIFSYYSLPRKIYSYPVKYNILTGSIYIGCSVIQKDQLQLIYNFCTSKLKS